MNWYHSHTLILDDEIRPLEIFSEDENWRIAKFVSFLITLFLFRDPESKFSPHTGSKYTYLWLGAGSSNVGVKWTAISMLFTPHYDPKKTENTLFPNLAPK